MKTLISFLIGASLFLSIQGHAATKFAVIADSRSSSDTPGVNEPILDKLLKGIATEKSEMTFFTGDLVFGHPDLTKFKKQLDLAKSIIARNIDLKTLYPAMGNHEVASREHEAAFLQTFDVPKNGPKGYEGLAYYVEKNNNLFVVVATDHYGEEGLISKKQLSWLDRILTNHAKADHVFVFGHQPAFPAGPHEMWSLDQFPEARDAFWRILRRHNVDIYFTAHEHLFFMNRVQGVFELVVGAGGAPLYHGFEGDFYHFAAVTLDGARTTVQIKDDTGAIRRNFSFTRDKTFRNVTAEDVSKFSTGQLIQEIKTGPDNVAVMAMWSATRRKASATIPAIEERLLGKYKNNENTKFTVQAIKALALLKARKMAPFFKQNTSNQNGAISRACKFALEHLAAPTNKVTF